MGRPGQTDEAESHALLDQFVAAGGNFIDTADVYQNGLSEEIIGTWLSKKQELRHRLVIATKVCGIMDSSPNARGLTRHHIMNGIEGSLKRLRTDYIDIYQTHCWDAGTPIEETLHALNDLVRCGKVRYVGVSNVTGWQLQKIVSLNRAFGYPDLITLQPQYSLLCRSTEWELIEPCLNEGIGIIPWSPLKGGLLTGKFSKNQKQDPSSSRVAWVDHNPGERASQSHPSFENYSQSQGYWELMDALDLVAKKHEATQAQVAIAWLLQKPGVSSVIIGARTSQQLAENIHSAFVNLNFEEMQLLDEKSFIPPPYPYEMIERLNKSRKH
jgi:aryl-alcohol dehydrogenase-like predicted oxidoreductase